jgi:hypothetical protein
MNTKNMYGYANKSMDGQFPFPKNHVLFQKVNIRWNFLGPNFDQNKYNGMV